MIYLKVGVEMRYFSTFITSNNFLVPLNFYPHFFDSVFSGISSIKKGNKTQRDKHLHMEILLRTTSQVLLLKLRSPGLSNCFCSSLPKSISLSQQYKTILHHIQLHLITTYRPHELHVLLI